MDDATLNETLQEFYADSDRISQIIRCFIHCEELKALESRRIRIGFVFVVPFNH